jgi:hypothetical protein
MRIRMWKVDRRECGCEGQIQVRPILLDKENYSDLAMCFYYSYTVTG